MKKQKRFGLGLWMLLDGVDLITKIREIYYRRGGPRARPCPGLLAPCAIATLFLGTAGLAISGWFSDVVFSPPLIPRALGSPMFAHRSTKSHHLEHYTEKPYYAEPFAPVLRPALGAY